MIKLDRHFRLAVIVMGLLLWGCGGTRMMMPTPNVYLNDELDLYQDLAPELKSTEVRLFYMTDRMPEKDNEGLLR